LNRIEPRAELTFRLLPSLAVVAFALLLTFGSTVLAAWKSVYVRPLEVLRAE
jgi:ABC-type lipoprotein release transport system permease subunit